MAVVTPLVQGVCSAVGDNQAASSLHPVVPRGSPCPYHLVGTQPHLPTSAPAFPLSVNVVSFPGILTRVSAQTPTFHPV